MKHVDALSRYPMMTITTEDSIIEKIRRLQAQEDLQTIKDILKTQYDYNNYFLKGDILYKIVDDRELFVVPKGLQREVIRLAHDRGHFSTKKVKELTT